MRLTDFLLQEKSSIVKRWSSLLRQTYPQETSAFLEQESDRFRNPVGSRFAADMELIFDSLCQGVITKEAQSGLEDMIKIRTVQDFSPSEAMGGVFLLKQAVWEQLQSTHKQGVVVAEIAALDTLFDQLTCHSFDLYMKAREKIFEIRVNEIKNRTFKLWERVNSQGLKPPKE